MFADFSLADGLGVIGSLVICSAYLAVSLGRINACLLYTSPSPRD